MCRFTSVLWVLICSSLLLAEGGKSDAEAIQGKWNVVSAVYSGKAAKNEENEKDGLGFWTINKTQIVYSEKSLADYMLNTAKKPKEIDATHPAAANQTAETLLGIYELEGDQLRICIARSGSPRPTKFESAAESKTNLIVLKRVKP